MRTFILLVPTLFLACSAYYICKIDYRPGTGTVFPQSSKSILVEEFSDLRPSSQKTGKEFPWISDAIEDVVPSGDNHFDQSIAFLYRDALVADLKETNLFEEICIFGDTLNPHYILSGSINNFQTKMRQPGASCCFEIGAGVFASLSLLETGQLLSTHWTDFQKLYKHGTRALAFSLLGLIAILPKLAIPYNVVSEVKVNYSLIDASTREPVLSGIINGEFHKAMPVYFGRGKLGRYVEATLPQAIKSANTQLINNIANFLKTAEKN